MFGGFTGYVISCYRTSELLNEDPEGVFLGFTERVFKAREYY